MPNQTAVAYTSMRWKTLRDEPCKELEEQCSLLLAKRSERSVKAADGGDGSKCRRSGKKESGARTDANE